MLGTAVPRRLGFVAAAGTLLLLVFAFMSQSVLAADPDAPQNVAATPADGQITLEWEEPADTGGKTLSDYLAECDPDPGPVGSATTTDLTVVIDGLANGEEYTCSVTANYEGGDTSVSDPVSATPIAAPGPPQDFEGDPGDGQVALTWAHPASDSTNEITGYELTSDPDSPDTPADLGRVTSFTAAGLANGTEYEFSLRAINDAGTSTPATVTSTPFTTPDAPAGVIASGGDGLITVEWDAPVDDGGSPITSYTAVCERVGDTSAQSATTEDTDEPLSLDVTGLANGQEYACTVTAANDAGDGPDSSAANATPSSVPSRPTSVNAVAGDGQATVTWNAPGTGGSPITGYVITSDPDSPNSPLEVDPGTSGTITGLTNGETYTFTVAAENEAGVGNESAASNPVTPTEAEDEADVPAAPAAPSVDPGDESIEVDWSAPADDGGSPITGYDVTCSRASGGGSISGSTTGATELTLTGAANGVAYTCTVTAINAVGSGPASPASAEVTPSTVPGAPTDLEAEAGDAAIVLGWEEAPDGGAEITEYEAECSNGTTITETVSGDTLIAQFGSSDGVQNGVTYDCTVRAINANGAGPVSVSVSVTPSSSSALRLLDSVEIRPSSGRVTVGRSLQMTATGSDEDGASLGGLEFAWLVNGSRTETDSGDFSFRPQSSGTVRIGVEVHQPSTGKTITIEPSDAGAAVIQVGSPRPTPTPVVLPPATNPMPDPMDVGPNGASGVFGPRDPVTLDLNLSAEDLGSDEPLSFSLDIPDNAFPQNANVTALALTGSEASALPPLPDNVAQAAQVPVRVRVFVDGELVEEPMFERSWQMTLSIPNSVLRRSTPGNIVVYRLPEGASEWTELRGTVNTVNGTITITGDTLSTFRVAGIGPSGAPTPTPAPVTPSPQPTLPPTGGAAPTTTNALLLVLGGMALIAGGGLYLRRRRSA